MDILSFISNQLNQWPEVRQRFDDLASICAKTVVVNSTSIQVQFNPARATSVAARVDTISVSQRLCFLCADHRPTPQIYVPWRNYHILLNPYPILPGHLTLADSNHSPQAIAGRMEDMLALTKLLEGFIVFYNGPQCGASAPDHFHFQAVEAGYTPLETVMDDWMKYPATSIFRNVAFQQRLCFSGFHTLLSGRNAKTLCSAFMKVYRVLGEEQATSNEPKMNIFCRYNQGLWHLHIIPRRKHRPDRFFATGDHQMLISPGALDMAGVIITPRKSDYERITSDDIEQIYREVAIFEF